MFPFRSPNSSSRKSTGNIQIDLSNKSEENNTNLAYDLNFSLHSETLTFPLLPINRPNSEISLSEQEKQRWFYSYNNTEKNLTNTKENNKNNASVNFKKEISSTLNFSTIFNSNSQM